MVANMSPGEPACLLILAVQNSGATSLNVSSFCQVLAIAFGAHVALNLARAKAKNAVGVAFLTEGASDDVAYVSDS